MSTKAMKLAKASLLLAFLLCSSAQIFAQFDESYFRDTENKEGGVVIDHIKGNDYVIIAGKSFDRNGLKPAITKIDTLGNVIWTTATTDTVYYAINPNYFQIFEADGFVYLSLQGSSWNVNLKINEIWKVDATNGEIIWKTYFEANGFNSGFDFINYGNDKCLMSYSHNSAYKLAIIDKITGVTLSTHSAGTEYGDKTTLGTDDNLDIYYTNADSVFKASGANPDNILWRTALPTSYEMEEYLEMYVDANDSLYLFGVKEYNRGKIVSINSATGDLNWIIDAPGNEINHVDFSVHDGYIYSTWNHAYTGGGQYYCWTSKTDRLTGEVIWESAYDFYNAEEQGFFSLDLDDNGDVFLTGDYENIDKNIWGIAKLDGNTGNAIYDLHISVDSLENDNISIGKVAFVVNNKPYFIGQMQTYQNNDYGRRSRVTFVEIDNATGNILKKKFIGGYYQFPSKTIQIERHGPHNTVVFKQEGRFPKVEMYDFNQELLWSRSFSKHYMLLGDLLHVEDNGNIIFSAQSHEESYNSPPYYNYATDSLHFFRLSPYGQIISDHSTLNGFYEYIPTNLISDNKGTAFLFYQANTTSMVKIDQNGFAVSQAGILINTEHLSRTKNFIDHTDSTCYFAGTNALALFNKSTQSFTTIAIIPSLNRSNYVLKNGSDSLLIGGKGNLNTSNREMLVKFDIANQDTLWSRAYTGGSILKIQYDTDSSHIYTMAQSTFSTVIPIRKVDVLNGDLIWTYTYSYTQNGPDVPVDMSVDPITGHITVTGYTGRSDEEQVTIFVLDSNGQLIEEYHPSSTLGADNLGHCVSYLANGSTWIGGQLIHDSLGRGGFLYRTDPKFTISTVSGTTYFDENANGVKDMTERGLGLFKVSVAPTNVTKYSDNIGDYTYYLEEGSYTISPDSIANWQLSSDSASYTISIDTLTEITDLDFGFTPTVQEATMSVAVSSGFTRCDRQVWFDIVGKNTGTTINNGFLWVGLDSMIQDVLVDDVADTLVNSYIFGWRITDLYPSETINKRILLELPGVSDGLELGDSILVDAYVNLETPSTTDDFRFSYTPEILCAFDPNDKLVSPRRGGDNFTLFEEKLTYTVRFQNTGTDTAFTVVVKDTLDQNLNLNSLDILSSSHMEVLETSLIENELTFSFNNIMLPDSNKTYEGSQGYITYSISTIGQLAEGTVINNSAGIYFDSNPPVITNQTSNTMVSELPSPVAIPLIGESLGLRVYPNPVKETFYIEFELPNGAQDIRISSHDVLGRELFKHSFMDYRSSSFQQEFSLPRKISGLVFLSLEIGGNSYTYKLMVQ